MKQSRIERDIVLALVRSGDRVRIRPIRQLPNFPREITVDYVEGDSFIYGLSPRCDGYSYPFCAIEQIEILK